MALDAPIGPRQLPLGSLNPEQFEELCYLLARLEFPDVVRPAAPDGGLDAFRPGESVATAIRGWQAKRFTGRISWRQCVDSTKAAVASYQAPWITFCFPFDLTDRQRRQFVRQLVEGFPKIQFDWWGRSELHARLTDSRRGVEVANYFFGEPQGGRAETLRAVKTGGELNTSRQALERLVPVGDFFRRGDPYFSYQTGHRDRGAPASPPAAGTVLRVELETEEGVSLVDARSALPDALERHGPAGRLVFSGIEGHHALKKFQRLGERGGRLTLEQGVEWHWDRLPPAVRDLFEPVEAGALTFVADSAVPVLRLKVVASSERGKEELDFDLVGTGSVREGWDGVLGAMSS
jgi:hypothetical protein